MWNQRYNTDEFIYGKEPNDFLKQEVFQIPKGDVLSLGEGEGRNSLFLAQQGYNVTALDISDIGLSKARKLAQENDVAIKTVQADLSSFEFNKEQYDGIVSIFCHLPSDVRRRVNRGIVESLKVGGVLILEGYSKEQVNFNTGGPKLEEFLLSIQEMEDELMGLEFKTLRLVEREVNEGILHTGLGSVIQIVAVKR